MSSRYSLCFAALLIVYALAPPRAISQNPVAGWAITDVTGAIALNAVEERDSMIKVSFKNKSASAITAIALSFKANAHHYEDWFNTETSGLAPGKAFDITTGAEECTDHKIRISAILFEDGSGKGDLSQLDIMNSHRFGQILEATRIRNILQGRNKSDDDASMDTLNRKIGKKPSSVDEALSSLEGVRIPGLKPSDLKLHGEKSSNAILWGVSITREGALRHMENVKQLPIKASDQKTPSRASYLSFLQDTYEKQNNKGIALLHRMQGGD
jgi:hypothetical protein